MVTYLKKGLYSLSSTFSWSFDRCELHTIIGLFYFLLELIATMTAKHSKPCIKKCAHRAILKNSNTDITFKKSKLKQRGFQ
jgi:hypothetical protein